MIKGVRDQLDSNASRQEMAVSTINDINQFKDPYTREMALVRFYQAQQQPEQMKPHLIEAIKLQPEDKRAMSTLFVLYLNDKQFAEAQSMLPRLSELDADDAHGAVFRIKLALAMNNTQDAVTLAEKLTHDSSNFGGSWELYGEAEQAAGRLGNAAEEYRRALLLQPNNSDALNKLIFCDVALKKTSEARSELNDACQRYPTDPVYRMMRQRFEIQYGDPEKSILPELEAQILSHPDVTDGYTVEIEALQACARAKASVDDTAAAAAFNQRLLVRLIEAVKRWPEDLGFSGGLAQYYSEAKDVDNAEKVMTNLSKTKRWVNQPRPLIILGEIYLSAGKLDRAEATLKQALAIQSTSTDALLEMADCKQRENDPDAALAHFCQRSTHPDPHSLHRNPSAVPRQMATG